MNRKMLALGTILAGLAIFIWGAASHTLFPEPVTMLKDADAVAKFVDANARGNGAYFDSRGVLMVVSMLPGRPDKTQMMGGNLVIELITNILQAGLLLLLLLKSNAATMRQRVGFAALAGLAAWVAIDVSYWNWYGWPAGLTALAFTDTVVGWALGGLVLSWAINKSQSSAGVRRAVA
jgi:hypothetical protein